MRERDKPAYPVTVLDDEYCLPENEQFPGLTKYELTVIEMAKVRLEQNSHRHHAVSMATDDATAIWDALEGEK